MCVPLNYKKGRLFIGNPPFGVCNTLAVKFYNRCCEFGDYIAFILPISQLNNTLQMYRFDLIYSEDLGEIDYSGITLHCCFNIYQRPKSGIFNLAPQPKVSNINIVEYRRGTNNETVIPPNWDYAMCNWGNGCLGAVPEYIGQYAQEVYFYCKKSEYKEKLIEILQPDHIREYVKSISAKKISVARLYRYIDECIPDLNKIPPNNDLWHN